MEFDINGRRINSFRTLLCTHVHSPAHPVSLLSAAIELTSYTKQFLWWMDIREWELISALLLLFVFFLLSLLSCIWFALIFIRFAILFYFIFCFVFVCFNSLPFPCHAVLWYATLYSIVSFQKGFFFISSLSFLFEFITCTAQKNNDVFYRTYFLPFSLSRSSSFFFLFWTVCR